MFKMIVPRRKNSDLKSSFLTLTLKLNKLSKLRFAGMKNKEPITEKAPKKPTLG